MLLKYIVPKETVVEIFGPPKTKCLHVMGPILDEAYPHCPPSINAS
jgi:hypothetical protein